MGTIKSGKIDRSEKINALGKAWTVLIPKAGYSTNDCHRSDRVIAVPPGGSTSVLSGTSLFGNGVPFGFCLTPTDQWTLAAGWPDQWALDITYTK